MVGLLTSFDITKTINGNDVTIKIDNIKNELFMNLSMITIQDLYEKLNYIFLHQAIFEICLTFNNYIIENYYKTATKLVLNNQISLNDNNWRARLWQNYYY